MRLRIYATLSVLLLASLAFAKPVQVKLYVTNIQMTYEIDSQVWKWEREFSPKGSYQASALYRNEEDSTKSIRIGISKVAQFPNEQKPRALRNQEEIPKLFADEGGIGNCSFGDLQGYVQQGKDTSGEFIHVIMMEPAFGGIVFLVARNIPMADLEATLETFKTNVLR
jgi:hypothetical protein